MRWNLLGMMSRVYNGSRRHFQQNWCLCSVVAPVLQVNVNVVVEWDHFHCHQVHAFPQDLIPIDASVLFSSDPFVLWFRK